MALTKTTTEEELDDTATSPVKSRDVDMTGRELSDSGVKKRLLPSIEQNGENLIGDALRSGLAPMAMITDGDTSSAGIVAAERSLKTVKRTKKDGADSPSLGSADSRDGSVRSQ